MVEIPAACADLDFVRVSATLAKHFGDLPAAARELGVSGPDLRHLTWAKPKLLEEAEERCWEIVARAQSEVIQAIFSDDPDRRMWGSSRFLSSWLGRNSPLAPARRSRGEEAPAQRVTMCWADGDGEAVRPAAVTEALPVEPIPEPPPEPKARPERSPPLVARRFAPAPQPRPELERSRLRRPSRGGYR